MSVIITSETGATVETVFWLDARTQSVGIGLRRSADDAWADVATVANLRAVWATGDGGRLTTEQLADCLRCLAGAVYE